MSSAPRDSHEIFSTSLETRDPEISQLIGRENQRQAEHLEMIASENYASRAILEAVGSALTNKYAEGYPGKRYYGGCEWVDAVEDLGRKRGAALFSQGSFVPHVNLQPHSGAQANQAVFLALLNPGDCILSCSLSHGGHLTHGSPVNLSGKWFRIVNYGVRSSDERLDLDQVRELAIRERPKLLIAGYSSYSRTIDFAAFRSIADEVGATLMVDMAHISGLVASGVHPSPFPHAQVVTSTTHKTLRGPRSGFILCHPDLAKKIDSAVFPGLQGGPLMHVVAAKAVMFLEAAHPQFRTYIEHVVRNASVMAKALGDLGYRIVSNGTDNHLLVVDLSSKGVSGKEAEVALDRASINANRNTIPFDKQSPFVTSGLRLGTPAGTTRGLGEREFELVARWIDQVITNSKDEGVLASVSKQVHELCARYPIYPDRRHEQA